MKEIDYDERLENDNEVKTDKVINMSGKLGAMYNGLHDISSRLKFLVAVNERFAAQKKDGRKISQKELNEYKEIISDFRNRYILPGDSDILDMIFLTMGHMKAENDHKSYLKYQSEVKLNKGIDQADPYIDDKSKWMVDQLGLSIDNMAITTLIDELQDLSDVDKNKIQKSITAGENSYYKNKKLSNDNVSDIKSFSLERGNYETEDIEDWIEETSSTKSVSDAIYYETSSRIGMVDSRYKEGKEDIDVDADRIREDIIRKYRASKTVEEKLNVVIDVYMLTSMQEIIYGAPLLEQNLSRNILDLFVRDYIANADIKTIGRVIAELGRINTKKIIEIVNESKTVDQEFSAEGKVGQKKADWLIRSSAPGLYYGFSGNVGMVFKTIIDKIRENGDDGQFNPEIEALLEKNNINEDITVGDFLKAKGITDEKKITDFINEHDVKLQDKAIDIFLKEHENISEFTASFYMKLDFIDAYTNSIIDKESNKIISDAKLSAPDKEKYAYSLNLFSGEPKTKGIENWLKEEGELRSDALDVISSKQLINDFNKKVMKGVGYDQYIMLHTGSDVVNGNKQALEDNCAKALAALQLKNSGVKFDLKKIHKVFGAIKQSNEFNAYKSDLKALKRALSSPSGIINANAQLYSDPFKVPEDGIKDYITEMNMIHKNMMSKKGRSDEYKAVYDIIEKLAKLKCIYDFNQPNDIKAAVKQVADLNASLLNASQNYITGKEKIRTYEDGRERFSNALDGIGAMSRYTPGVKDAVNSIVDRINLKRDVKKHPGRKVDLSSYGGKRAKEAKSERIRKKKPNKSVPNM